MASKHDDDDNFDGESTIIYPGRPIFWDPQNPSALLILAKNDSIRESNADATINASADNKDAGTAVTADTLTTYTLYADSGVAGAASCCNEHELTALMQILTAHEEYHHHNDNHCRLQRMGNNSGGDGSGDDLLLLQQNDGNLSWKNWKKLSQRYRSVVRDCLAAWKNDIEDPLEPPGAIVTTTRISKGQENWALLSAVYSVMHLADIYLPLVSPTWSWGYDDTKDGHGGDDEVFLGGGDLNAIPGYVTADTVRYLRLHLLTPPELFDARIPAMVDSQSPEHYPDRLYWKFLTRLVLCGCLEQAWAVLTLHSLYNHAQIAIEENLQPERVTGQQIIADFEPIRHALLRAPLPAGRSADYDDDHDINEGRDEEMRYDEDIDEMIVDGLDVSTTDYRFWDVTSPVGTSMSAIGGDYPILYSPETAMRKHRQWQEYVLYVRRTSALRHKIPELDHLLAILGGDFTKVTFENWAEQLCAELLYRTPDLRPRNVSARTRRLLKDHYCSSGDNTTPPAEYAAVVSIMQGEAGRAMEELFLYGGGSGAALPSTLMSLLLNLFVDACIIPPESAASRKTELLTDAASAILASLQNSHSDLGAQLAVRLLLPYAYEKGNTEIVAAIANILEHYAPSTDHYARTMITLCTPLVVQKKSVYVLDGCTSILLYQYRKHMQSDNPGIGAMILCDGIELESHVLPVLGLGCCYKALAAECHTVCVHMLQAMVDAIEGTLVGGGGSYARNARLMAEAIECHALDTTRIAEAIQLVHIHAIIECDSVRGRTSYATPVTFHMPLLRIAQDLITESIEAGSMSTDVFAVFDTHGVSVLMQRLLELSQSDDSSRGDLRAMELSFQKALTQAIVAENAKKRQIRSRHHWNQVDNDIESIRYADLFKHEADVQERFVTTRMLDF